MDFIRRKMCLGRKKSRCRRKAADSEQGRILLSKTQVHPRQQPEGHPLKPRRKIPGFLRPLYRNKEPKNVIHLTETSTGFQQLVQKGQFLEAYQRISALTSEGQDCGPQYQALAQSMWQVVQQALQGVEHGPELELKLEEVLATVEYTQDMSPGMEDGTLQDGGVAAWGGQLERLLRNDAEAQVPTLRPRDQLDPFLEKLDMAVRQGLGSPRASRFGARFWARYRTCFQEVLLSRLWELMRSFGANRKSCHVLYTWGRMAMFGQLGETPLNAPSAAQEPMAGHLLDPVMFVTWMSQMQEKLVGLIQLGPNLCALEENMGIEVLLLFSGQEELEAALEKVLICDREKRAQFSYPTFLEIFQLLEETIKAVQPIGLPITSHVQAMVLKTFSKFPKRYQAEAVRFLQQNATARTFPEVHVLGNCCILRKTWQELSQAHVPPEDLGPAVQEDIHVIEGHSQDHLLRRVRALCQNRAGPVLCLGSLIWREGIIEVWYQSLLGDHFGRKDKDLVCSLQSLWQGLEGYPSMHSTPMYESIMRSLHMVIFGEYVQALATHLRTLAPRKWDSLRPQVETDIRRLDDTFRKYEGPDSAILQEPIMAIFQLSENEGRETLEDWLASFRGRFPDYLSSEDLEVEVKGRHCCCCYCRCC